MDFMVNGHEDLFSSPSSGDDSSWVLSLSDLMSLLLIFFLVWTTIKINHLQKNVPEQAATPPVMHLKDLKRLKGTLFKFSPTTTTGGGVMLVLHQEIAFEPGANRLSGDGQRMIAKIASALKGSSHYRLRIVGHSSSSNSSERYGSDIELSLARASVVANEFIAQGIDPERVLVQGLGRLEPGYASDKEQIKGLNRRVELIIEPAY